MRQILYYMSNIGLKAFEPIGLHELPSGRIAKLQPRRSGRYQSLEIRRQRLDIIPFAQQTVDTVGNHVRDRPFPCRH